MIRLVHQARIFTHVSTTLVAFPNDTRAAEELVASRLDLLSCSIHGASRETFLMYQRADRFEETIEKVRLIVAARDHLRSKSPKIQFASGGDSRQRARNPRILPARRRIELPPDIFSSVAKSAAAWFGEIGRRSDNRYRRIAVPSPPPDSRMAAQG